MPIMILQVAIYPLAISSLCNDILPVEHIMEEGMRRENNTDKISEPYIGPDYFAMNPCFSIWPVDIFTVLQ